ncbi:hypothetical protein [Pseudogulbenkiania sp. MAI-1]|uniref:hypothetical protein n=1 Tax=Pseudogulbenkiania sp. MAI-1 TaxID=990370 RepID=UPI00045E8243|nr:hypothetical protein [Pseudogulbenkiania sp. MAI-1]
MRVPAIAVVKMNGKAKKTGKPFEMHFVRVLRPEENVSSEAFNKMAAGFQISELPIDETAVAKFLTLPYPCEVELVLGQRLDKFGKGLEGYVQDYKVAIPYKLDKAAGVH